jgi:sigma-54 specific flagellar transcriptional regulator A
MFRPPFTVDSVVGQSARMHDIVNFVGVIADSDSSVLITGESGTGKELIANLIHHTSGRRKRPFIPVSCAILSESLIESELFGHERGAFTNAVRERPGRFELAEGGTLFLDDIDDVPLSMQVKLLRVLQSRTVERVGAVRQIPVDVRVLTGSKRDLRALVKEGTFREDLLYRLNVIPLQLPPLRDRVEDIPLLVTHFLNRYFRARGKEPKRLSAAMLAAFERYRWPGNVRELENACERIAQTCICDAIVAGCVPATILFHEAVSDNRPKELRSVAADAAAPLPDLAPPEAPAVSLYDRIHAVEVASIAWALRETGGNKSKAAALLNVKRSTLGDRIKKLHLGHLESGNTDS